VGGDAPRIRIEGEELGDAGAVWAPASVAYFARSPSPLVTHTNGLASGNHLVEATLHALYELLERDALSGVSVDGQLRIRERCRAVIPESIPDPELGALVRRVEAHDTKVVLLWVESRVPVHSFWSIFVNRRPAASVSTLNLGAGCHRDPVVAAARAITEAAQSRLAFIHGAREDRVVKPVDGADRVRASPAYRYFDRLAADTPWHALPHVASTDPSLDLFAAYEWLLGELHAVGQRIVRFDLTQPAIGIPVVKVLAPGLGFNRKLL